MRDEPSPDRIAELAERDRLAHQMKENAQREYARKQEEKAEEPEQPEQSYPGPPTVSLSFKNDIQTTMKIFGEKPWLSIEYEVKEDGSHAVKISGGGMVNPPKDVVASFMAGMGQALLNTADELEAGHGEYRPA